MKLIETSNRSGFPNKNTVQGVELDSREDGLALAKHLGRLAAQVLEPGTAEAIKQLTSHIGHRALHIQSHLLEKLSAPEQPEAAFTLLVTDVVPEYEDLPELTGQVLRTAVDLESRALAMHA